MMGPIENEARVTKQQLEGMLNSSVVNGEADGRQLNTAVPLVVNEELEDIRSSSFDHESETSMLTRFILQDRTVMNLVAESLLNSDVAEENVDYYAGQINCIEDSKSDALLIPHNDNITEERPPILIEIQRQIDQDFMIRLVHFCTCVYKRYRILPVVLIIVLDDFTDDLLKEGLLDSDSFGFNNDNEFLVKIQSTCWAKECFSITKNSITQHVNNGKPMSPLLLLSKHMIQQQSDLLTVNRDEEIAVTLEQQQQHMFNNNNADTNDNVNSRNKNILNIIHNRQIRKTKGKAVDQFLFETRKFFQNMAQATTPVDLFNMTKHFANEGLRCLNRIQLQPPDLSSSNEVDIAPNSPTNDFLAISAAVPPNFPQERIPFLQRIIDYNNSIINSKSQGKRREWHLTEEELTFIESHYTGGREEAEEGAKVSMPWSRVIFPEGQKRGFFRHCRSAMDVSRAYWALRVHVPKRRKRF